MGKVLQLARFEVRPEVREDAERAMHAYASFVRQALPGSAWTAYREGPASYVAIIVSDDATAEAARQHADGTHAFERALEPWLIGAVETRDCTLVTSSDLHRRVATDAAAVIGRPQRFRRIGIPAS